MDGRFVFYGLSQKYTLLMISLKYYNVEQLFFTLASRFNSFFQAQKLFYRFRDFKKHTAKQLQFTTLSYSIHFKIKIPKQREGGWNTVYAEGCRKMVAGFHFFTENKCDF